MVRIIKRRGRVFIMEGTQGFEPCYTWLTAKCVTTTLNARKVVFMEKEVMRLIHLFEKGGSLTEIGQTTKPKL